MAQETDNIRDNQDDEPLEVEIIAPSFVLKTKAPSTSQNLGETVEEADAAVAELAREYPQRASERVSDLERAFETMPASGDAQESIDALFAIAHIIRGEGGTFGFPLATTIANSLCTVLEGKSRTNQPLREAVHVHIASLRLVLSEHITGDGGARGAMLLNGLHKVSTVKTLSAG